MNILIIGDSFSTNNKGWPGMLGHCVTNRSQNGVGEYKIYKQSIDFAYFDCVIVCHTSPWRIHTPHNPVHGFSQERPHNDFMLSDMEYHSKHNKEMNLVKKYWDKYYDIQYQTDMYKLIVTKLFEIPNSIHITFHDENDTEIIKNNFHDIWKKHPGVINHLDEEGNKQVSEKVLKLINLQVKKKC